jgi:hypothetical protein
MCKVNSTLVEDFSLTQGGLLHRVLNHLGQAKYDERHVVVRPLLVILVTWLPLFILSVAQGVAYGPQIQIPFLNDFAVNTRFLVALPILLLAGSAVDGTWHSIAGQFLSSGLVSENELASFEAVIAKVNRLRDSVLPELVILVLAFVPSIFALKTAALMSGVTNWHVIGLGSTETSLAGRWFEVVSMPIFRVVLLRWIWRMLLWTSFLWRVSRTNLYLVATHSDRAAGLGFVTGGQKAYGPIVFAGSAVVAAQVGNAIAYEGQTLSAMKFPMIAYGVLAILLLVAPLVVLGPVLRKVKRKALREYGDLVTMHNQLFETKWIRDKRSHDDMILGNPDASSLIDLGDSFTVIRQMGIIPINKQTLVSLAAAAVLPMLPVILQVVPIKDVLHTVLKMLG